MNSGLLNWDSFFTQPVSLVVILQDGWIQLSKLQVEYKKVIKATDFYNAYMLNRNSKEIVYSKFHSTLKRK